MATSTIKRSTPHLEYVQDVYWWNNSWTCPADGMLQFVIIPSASNWAWYVSDSSNPDTGWSHRFASGTSTNCTYFVPCTKGAVFQTSQIYAVSSAKVEYFKWA